MVMSKQARLLFSLQVVRGHHLTRRPASLEFRRHKEVTNPGYIIGFLSQWKVYLDQIPVGPGTQHYRGKKLDPTIFEKVP